MQARPECQRDVLMDMLHDSNVPNEYKKAVRWALCLVDTAIRERLNQEEKFREFLYHIGQVAQSWPNWKKES